MERSMRIRIVVPITGLSAATLAGRKAMLERVKEVRTEVEMAVVREGPSSIESAYDEAYAGRELLREVVRAEQEGADAAIIWCAGDPALEAAREVVRIPVVGPGAAACAVAALLADRFTVLTMLDGLIPLTRRLVEAAGLGRRLASVRAIEIPVLDVEGDEEAAFRRLIGEAERAVTEDGAEAIVLGCMGLLHLSQRLMAHFRDKGPPIPVVNPAVVSLKLAETLVTLGLGHSKLTYPAPRKVEGLSGTMTGIRA